MALPLTLKPSRALFPFESSELFSKPQLTLQPIDVFRNERFKLDCTAVVYATERINASALQYSIYKDNFRVTSSNSLVDRAYLSKNGNYTCTVQVSSPSFFKQSQTVVLKAKGEQGETPGVFITLWCFYFGRRNESSSYLSVHFYGGILQSREKKKNVEAPFLLIPRPRSLNALPYHNIITILSEM